MPPAPRFASETTRRAVVALALLGVLVAVTAAAHLVVRARRHPAAPRTLRVGGVMLTVLEGWAPASAGLDFPSGIQVRALRDAGGRQIIVAALTASRPIPDDQALAALFEACTGPGLGLLTPRRRTSPLRLGLSADAIADLPSSIELIVRDPAGGLEHHLLMREALGPGCHLALYLVGPLGQGGRSSAAQKHDNLTTLVKLRATATCARDDPSGEPTPPTNR